MYIGGYDDNFDADNSILEYDITGDSYTQIGTMIPDSRSFPAVNVVKYEDFSEWCQ